jgi:hypothetical protein
MTKRMRANISALVLSLLCVAGAPADAAEVTNFKLKGNTATAGFQGFDPVEPCIESFAFVGASDTVEKVSPSGIKTLSLRTTIQLGQYDRCNDIIVFGSEGVAETNTFQFAKNLTSATLTATVSVADIITFQVHDYQVHLTWKATGIPEYVKTKETFSDPELGIKITAQAKSTQVDATATGTVVGIGSRGHIFNFTPQASDSATIMKEANGAIIIQH